MADSRVGIEFEQLKTVSSIGNLYDIDETTNHVGATENDKSDSGEHEQGLEHVCDEDSLRQDIDIDIEI